MPTYFSGTHYVPGMSAKQAHRAAQLEIPVLVAVLATIPVLVLTGLDLDGTWGTITEVLNWMVWLMFLAEAIVMFAISPDDSAYISHNKLDVAILILTPPFLPEALHFLWVLRLLRILDLLPVLGRVFRFNGFRYAATLAFLAVFGGGIAYAEIEKGRGVDEFDGVWWAMTTISTVGYGDEYPESVGGRILGMGMMLMGPILIGLVATGVGAMVAKQIERDLTGAQLAAAEELEELGEQVDEVEEDIEDVGEDLEALAGVDQQILAKLEEISARLAALERRGS